ncbi:phage major tail tube protein [Bartonella sp. HY761]|uniref:phage major tail tube protein n=1 Tax=Bartonella sp. HY761 TaxID=2979330 RepID=UPI0021FC1EBF|nr:phage major tail tube protein [Bartonella sp. HY761]UXN07513.1 phage major tail tube protein [Bartonella sp. HY761]
MKPIQLGHITNSDVYLEDNRLTGRVKEFKVGEISYKMVSHETLGQIAVAELPSRAMDPLKATLELQYPELELDARLKNPVKACRFMVHSYLDLFGGEGLDEEASGRLITTVTTLPAKKGETSFKLGEATANTYELSVIAMVQKFSRESTPLFEFDLFNGVHRIQGKNVWPQ